MMPTLFSVSYAGFWGQATLSTVDFIHKAKALGYSAVEIGGKRPHLSVLDYPDEKSLREIRQTAQDCGIEIATIAGYTDFTSGKESSEVPFVEMQVAYVRELSRIARTLGAKIVRVFSGYSRDAAQFTADWNRCVIALRESAAVAHEYGVVLGLQNHHDVGISVDGYEELLNEVNHENLKAMFDPWSVALTGVVGRHSVTAPDNSCMFDAAKRMAPRMVQTTLADYVRIDRFCYQGALVNYVRQDPPLVRAVPLGDGFLDLQAFFAGLKEGGFDGYVAYEMCSPLRGGGSMDNLDAAAKKSLDVIRGLTA